jgi:hypothetical protein
MLVSEQYTTAFSELVKDFLNEVVQSLQAYLATNNRNATGKSSDSIKTDNVTETGGQVVGHAGIQFVFTGRGPGGFPPLNAIIDWCNARGIPRTAAWNIAKHIAAEGTKLYQQGGYNDNALLDALSDDRINEFSKNIANLVAVNLNSDISFLFKKK